MLSSKLCAAVLFIAVAARADELPTPQDLDGLLVQKDWPGLLTATTKVLALRGTATAGFDRVDVWTKKGEAQLQSKQFAPASQSFAKAAEEKTATPDQKDMALALSRLAKKSDGKGFKTPARPGPSKMIDIYVPANRPEAFAALLAADIVDVTQRAEQTKAAMEPRPIVELVKQIGEVRPLDRVVNKTSDQSDSIEKAVAEHFITQVNKWADAAKQRLTQLKANADTQIQQRYTDRTTGRVQQRQRRQGLTPAEASEVQKLMGRAEQLAGTYQPIAAAMSESGKTALKPAETAIQSIYDLAKDLKTDAARPN